MTRRDGLAFSKGSKSSKLLKLIGNVHAEHGRGNTPEACIASFLRHLMRHANIFSWPGAKKGKRKAKSKYRQGEGTAGGNSDAVPDADSNGGGESGDEVVKTWCESMRSNMHKVAKGHPPRHHA